MIIDKCSVAGSAGVWSGTGFTDNVVAVGNASQVDWGDGAVMTCGAGVMAFRIIGVDQEGGEMTGLDAGGVAATDKCAVVWDMRCRPVGMAVYAGEGSFIGCATLVDSVGNGAVCRVDGGADTIVPG